MTALPLHLLPIEVAEALARGEHVHVMDEGRKVGEVVPEHSATSSLREAWERFRATHDPKDATDDFDMGLRSREPGRAA